MRGAHKALHAATVAWMLWLAPGATGCDAEETHAETPPDQSIEQQHWWPIYVNRKLDILFVIDNSGSMADEQASLAVNIARFGNVLENIVPRPDYHIGVVSTDLGVGPFGSDYPSCRDDGGALQDAPRVPDCSPPAGRFLSDIAAPDGTRIRNFDGTLTDTLSCIANLGAGGCGFAQPLEAMRRALDGSNPENAGFVRDDAFLFVVLITDDDDCSVHDTGLFDPSQTAVDSELGPPTKFRCFEFGVECNPNVPRAAGDKQACAPRDGSAYLHDVQTYVDFLRGLEADPSRVAVSIVTGPDAPVTVSVDGTGAPSLDPSCASASATATPAVRIAALARMFPQRNTVTSLCNEDISDALILIAESLSDAFPPMNACLRGRLADAAPERAGIQPDCVVSDVVQRHTSSQTETLVPECDDRDDPYQSSTLPCYLIEDDPLLCPDTPTELSLGTFPEYRAVEPGTWLSVRCLVE